MDQLTKAIAVARLDEGESVRALDGILYWTLHRNPGAAFGLFQRLPVLFTVLAVAVIAGILAVARRPRTLWSAAALGLVLGGAAGNLVDRIVRPPGPFRGHVVDFIDFRVWPTFNLADAAIVAGAIMIVLAEIRTGGTRRTGGGEHDG